MADIDTLVEIFDDLQAAGQLTVFEDMFEQDEAGTLQRQIQVALSPEELARFHRIVHSVTPYAYQRIKGDEPLSDGSLSPTYAVMVTRIHRGLHIWGFTWLHLRDLMAFLDGDRVAVDRLHTLFHMRYGEIDGTGDSCRGPCGISSVRRPNSASATTRRPMPCPCSSIPT